MNKYYYIINLFNSIDVLLLPTYSHISESLSIILFALLFAVIVIGIILYKCKKLKDIVYFYIVMSVLFAFTSTALICFISVPLNIYIAQLAMILPDSPKLSKEIVSLITVVSVIVSIAFSVLTICGVFV